MAHALLSAWWSIEDDMEDISLTDRDLDSWLGIPSNTKPPQVIPQEPKDFLHETTDVVVVNEEEEDEQE
jgi:hypothetical protein